MRIRTIVLATLALSTTVLAQAPASALPYDPYPWCAVYGGRMSGSSNCGFSTWNRCMATVSGIGRLLPAQFVLQPAGIGEPLAQAGLLQLLAGQGRIDCLRRPCAIAPPCSQGPSI